MGARDWVWTQKWQQTWGHTCRTLNAMSNIKERRGKQGTSKLEWPREINASFNMGISKFRSLSPQQVITQRKLKQRHTNALHFYDFQTTACNKKIKLSQSHRIPLCPLMPVVSEPYTTVYHVKQKLFTRRTELSFFIPHRRRDFYLSGCCV